MQGNAAAENGKTDVLSAQIIRAEPRRNLGEEQGESKQGRGAEKMERREVHRAAERKQSTWASGSLFKALWCRQMQRKKRRRLN